MSRFTRLVTVTAVAAAVTISGIALASHQFSDVPDSNIFHSDIGWMADNAITSGCNPPANDNYCPNDAVTRAQMAAFMRRLAERQVVDAGKLDGREGSAFLLKTQKATDSDLLDGNDSTAYRGSAGATIVDAVTVAGTAISIASISDFNAPTGDGAIVASGNATFIGNTGPDVGLLWVEVDGNGSCAADIPQSAGWWQTWDAPVSETSSTSSTKAVSAGNHRVDLCAKGVDDLTDTLSGSLTVQWVEQAQGGTTADVGKVDMSVLLAETHDRLSGD